MSTDSIRKMNQSDQGQSQIITKKNKEIKTLNDRKWNTPHFKSAEKPLTGNYNNTATDSDWRFMQCCIHPPAKDTMVSIGTGTGTTTADCVSHNTRTCFLGSRRILWPSCFQSPIFFSTQFQLFFMTFVSNLYLFPAPK